MYHYPMSLLKMSCVERVMSMSVVQSSLLRLQPCCLFVFAMSTGRALALATSDVLTNSEVRIAMTRCVVAEIKIRG